SLSALTLLRSFTIPFHKTMFLTPLKSQAANISKNYLKPLLVNSPFYNKFVDVSCSNSVLTKEFTNQSIVFFQYMGDDAERVRSYSVDMLMVDEVQSMDPELLAVVAETLTASSWRNQFFTGTPLSLDNLIQQLWEESSQCEFVIKCESCGFWNIPSLNEHILGMIGKLNLHISEKYPATVCYKCAKPVSPRRTGVWVPKFKEKMNEFEGYHIPQIIMPMHYADYGRWKELLDKKAGRGPTPWYRFVNEVLGESFELASTLISLSDLQKAACIGPNEIDNFRQRRGYYNHIAIGVDWGGGGASGLSQTVVVVAGMRNDGVIEIPYGARLGPSSDPEDEAKFIFNLFQIIMPLFIAHDCTVSGILREVFLRQFGIPASKILPMMFVGTAANYMILPVLMTNRNRTYYKIDRTKSLQLVCGAVKSNKILFFENEIDTNQKLLSDFLSLVEEKSITIKGRETYRIYKRKNTSDDFAAAVSLACMSLWYVTGRWPKLTDAVAETVLDKLNNPEEPVQFI
ncbi:MAG: phage terminase large subunit family protein, partial [Nitrososphaerota archaeon]